jgi:hypothetical protein
MRPQRGHEEVQVFVAKYLRADQFPMYHNSSNGFYTMLVSSKAYICSWLFVYLFRLAMKNNPEELRYYQTLY